MTVWNPFEIFVLLSIRPFPVEWTADMVYGHFHRMTCWPGGGSSVDPTELRRLAGRTGIALGILEKDQALTLVLGFLARESCARDLAFKGGTALSKTYFEGYRLSEDLDFTAVRDVSDDISEAAPRLLEAERRAGVRLARVERVPGGRSGRTLKVRYEDMNLHPNHVLLPAEPRPIHDPYRVVPRDARMRTMDLREIVAEKIRSLFMRSQPVTCTTCGSSRGRA